jgi:hypothetical protein
MSIRRDARLIAASRELRERHCPKLLRAPQRVHRDIAAIFCDQTLKTRPWHEIHDLCEEGSASVHGGAPDQENRELYRKTSCRVQIDTKQNLA